jgi:Flp pilus assembly protein TadG
MFRLFRRDGEKGASLVEFAVVLPLLILLVFGIMESGWLFAQQVEIRNAAREGARLAVVDFPDPGDSTQIIAETCSRATLSASRASVYLSQNNAGSDSASAVVTVAQRYESLTGILPMFEGLTIRSTAEMRIEREEVNWGAVAGSDPGNDAGACP